MWLFPSAVYWSSLGLLGYTYAGYPLTIYLLSRLRPRAVRRARIEPSVSVVIAARDEERHIAQKLENLLSLDYPQNLLQLIVVSDGSGDGTDSIVERFQARGVELLRLPGKGKAAALNKGVASARGEIVVLSDARQLLEAPALRETVECFADPGVGAVTGELQLAREKGPGLYWAYERRIREAEARWDSVVGASGCFLAIRRHLYHEIPEGLILDDVYTPMQIVLKGYRVLHLPQVKVFDDEASIGDEFSRKARTLAGNYQLIQQVPQLLSPLHNRLFVQFLSHKVLRLVCPFALITLFLSNAQLVLTLAPGWPFYLLTMGAQLGGYGLALKHAVEGEESGPLARFSHTFVTLNLAALEGLRRFLFGDFSWSTARRGRQLQGEVEV